MVNTVTHRQIATLLCWTAYGAMLAAGLWAVTGHWNLMVMP